MSKAFTNHVPNWLQKKNLEDGGFDSGKWLQKIWGIFVFMLRQQSLDKLSLSKTHCCMVTVRESKGVTKQSKYHGM